MRLTQGNARKGNTEPINYSMVFKQIFVLLGLAFVVDALSWKNCGKGNNFPHSLTGITSRYFLHNFPKGWFVFGFAYTDTDRFSPVEIGTINLSPDPLILRKGEKIKFSGMFMAKGPSGMNFKLDVKLKRKDCLGKWNHFGWLWVFCLDTVI